MHKYAESLKVRGKRIYQSKPRIAGDKPRLGDKAYIGAHPEIRTEAQKAQRLGIN